MSREVVTTTREHATADVRVSLLGAWRTVTGAMTRIDGPAGAVLVDCGITQGRERRDAPDLAAARSVDAIVLTHGHTDHVGSLPALFDAGFDGPVLGTRASLAIAEINLRDGIRLEGGSDGDVRRFVAAFQKRARVARYDQPTTIAGLELVFREAGHILGSASLEVGAPRSRLVLSGDLGRPGTPLLRDPFTAWPRPVDLVVMESTYGAREHGCGMARARDTLERVVRRAIAERGHVLVPAFAIGRTQTILYHLNDLVESGAIPPVPVAVDTPMGLRVTELYADSTKLFDDEALDRIARGDDPLDFEALYAVRRARDSHRLREVEGPMVVIAGSGMCTGGRIVRHLIELLPRPETTVLLVGFQASGTPGRALQKARTGDTVELGGERIRVGGRIETLSGLSAHADRNELAHWLDAIPGRPRVALHHGDPKAQEALAAWLTR